MRSTIVGRDGSVYVTLDGGQTWGRENSLLEPEDQVRAAWFSKDGNGAVLVSIHGSIFVKTDRAQEWAEEELELEAREEFHMAPFNRMVALACLEATRDQYS